MALTSITTSFTLTFLLTLLIVLFNGSTCLNLENLRTKNKTSIPKEDARILEFALNLEYLEAEFLLWGSQGSGLDTFDPELAQGGPSPFGAQKANLDDATKDIIYQFGLQQIGHIRALKKAVKGFARPQLNLSATQFSNVIACAFERKLNPPFNPYANSINFLIASYFIPYVGLTGYVGLNSQLQSPAAKQLVAGLLAVKSGQDAVIRTLLYQKREERVEPYQLKVEGFANSISKLRNKLGRNGMKDEGILVPTKVGAQGKVATNLLAGDKYSLGYPRTPQEILRILYGTADENKVGGFFPMGAGGKIAKSYIHQSEDDLVPITGLHLHTKV